MILLPLKENTASLPKLPLERPCRLAPSDSAASSSTGTPACSSSGSSSSICALCPYRLTITAAFGRTPSRASAARAWRNAAGDMLQPRGSESTKTGVAPSWRIGLALATKVRLEHSTASPGPTPSRRKPRCSAAVPELVAAACRMPTHCASSRSKASTCGPSGAIQLDSKASRTSGASSSPRCGADR